MWTVYWIVLDGQMDFRLAESLLMLPDAVTTLSLAKVDHIKLTTIVVRVLFAVASLAHALLATVCMYAWNLLAQTAHKDPKHQPALGRVSACPILPGKQVLGWLAGKKPKDAVMLATWSLLIKTGKLAVSWIRPPGTCLRR